MTKRLSDRQIEHLKRHSKQLARTEGMSYSAALETIAKSNGYQSWALLQKTRNRRPETLATMPKITADAFRSAVKDYINSLDPSSVLHLCHGTSLWVSTVHFLSGSLSRKSFRVLGPVNDRAQRQFGADLGMTLAINYDGLGDAFVFPDADSDDLRPDPWQVPYTTEVGRANLLELADQNYEVDFEVLQQHFESLNDADLD